MRQAEVLLRSVEPIELFCLGKRSNAKLLLSSSSLLKSPFKSAKGIVMHRRDLLIAGGALPLLASSSLRAQQSSKPLRCEVAVIGAGLAGLYTAMQLQAEGKDVLVCEANSRAGGRLETTEVDGLRFELGAVEVGENYARFLALAKSLKVELIKPEAVRIPGTTISIDGRLYSESDWAKSDLNPQSNEALRAMAPSAWLMAALAGPNPLSTPKQWRDAAMQKYDVPLREHLTSLIGSSPAKSPANLLRMMEIAGNFNDIATTSTLDVLRRDALRRGAGPGVGTLAVAGGSQALPLAMAKSLKRPMVHAEVTRIAQIGRLRKRYELSNFINFDVPPVVHADSVVIATPASALRLMSIEHPKFDVSAIAALIARPMTQVTTLHFRPTRKFWEADGLSPNMWIDGPLERVFAAANAAGEVERIIVWINGRAAQSLHALGDGLAQYVQMELARIRPATQGSLQFLAARSWGELPPVAAQAPRHLARSGAYAEIAAGQCRAVALALDASQKLPKGLCLAGEHMVMDFAGMEAALASAERAVEQL
jgi:monoamine oxidase